MNLLHYFEKYPCLYKIPDMFKHSLAYLSYEILRKFKKLSQCISTIIKSMYFDHYYVLFFLTIRIHSYGANQSIINVRAAGSGCVYTLTGQCNSIL